MNAKPAAPENNKHHTMSYYSEQDWWESEFGKGPSDPDVIGHYPDEVTDSD